MWRSGVRFVSELTPTADLVVVGGGIIGCATAFFAARAGLRVVVLERRPALATLTTPASAGAFRLQFDNPEEIALVREGVELFDAFEERTGLDGWDLGLRHGGYLFCSMTDATLERSRRLVERQRGWGLTDVELLDGDEARRRWPYLSPEVRGARYRAADGWLDAKRLAIGYAAAASNAGAIPGAASGGSAVFCTRTDVTGFLLTDDGSRLRGVRTSGGDLQADVVVIAAGPFTAQVAKLAGLELDIRPTRRQKLVIPELPDVPADAPMTIEEETAAHWRPAMRGCLALFTDPDIDATEPADPVPISADWAFGLLDPSSDHALARVVPFWREAWRDGAPSVHWYLQAGQYEYTPDRRPYLGPAMNAGPDGLHLNGGYSGHGIMAGAAGSRLVVDLLRGAADRHANAFRVDRPIASREHDIL
ncbi:MAG: NAD(P)/FAD-dependent oxidoreductase [Candidatus Limnocylindria bacterium]